MLISDEVDQYDGKLKMVLYNRTKEGTIEAREEVPEFTAGEDLANEFYRTKSFELKRLANQALAGEISPLKIFMDLHNMNVPDLASRIKISPAKVKKHLTVRGFKKVTVEILQRYARVFDIAVADFFQILYVKNKTQIQTNHYHDRLIQSVVFKQ